MECIALHCYQGLDTRTIYIVLYDTKTPPRFQTPIRITNPSRISQTKPHPPRPLSHHRSVGPSSVLGCLLELQITPIAQTAGYHMEMSKRNLANRHPMNRRKLQPCGTSTLRPGRWDAWRFGFRFGCHDSHVGWLGGWAHSRMVS